MSTATKGGSLLLFKASNFDGSRIYLDKTIIKPQKMKLWDKQKSEHQCMICLSCWGKFDPYGTYLLSSWSNSNLKSVKHSDVALGAGHF